MEIYNLLNELSTSYNNILDKICEWFYSVDDKRINNNKPGKIKKIINKNVSLCKLMQFIIIAVIKWS